MMGYDDDDGDEFGLPSISSMKRRTKRRENEARAEPGGLMATPDTMSDLQSRRYSNSADIAVERPAPSYPMPKKSEGKILRPQYKEILRGMPFYLRTLGPGRAPKLINKPRPRKRPAPNQLPLDTE